MNLALKQANTHTHTTIGSSKADTHTHTNKLTTHPHNNQKKAFETRVAFIPNNPFKFDLMDNTEI